MWCLPFAAIDCQPHKHIILGIKVLKSLRIKKLFACNFMPPLLLFLKYSSGIFFCSESSLGTDHRKKSVFTGREKGDLLKNWQCEVSENVVPDNLSTTTSAWTAWNHTTGDKNLWCKECPPPYHAVMSCTNFFCAATASSHLFFLCFRHWGCSSSYHRVGAWVGDTSLVGCLQHQASNSKD